MTLLMMLAQRLQMHMVDLRSRQLQLEIKRESDSSWQRTEAPTVSDVAKRNWEGFTRLIWIRSQTTIWERSLECSAGNWIPKMSSNSMNYWESNRCLRFFKKVIRWRNATIISKEIVFTYSWMEQARRRMRQRLLEMNRVHRPSRSISRSSHRRHLSRRSSQQLRLFRLPIPAELQQLNQQIEIHNSRNLPKERQQMLQLQTQQASNSQPQPGRF